MAYSKRTRRVAVTPESLRKINLIVAALYPGENGMQGDVIEVILNVAWATLQHFQAKKMTPEQMRKELRAPDPNALRERHKPNKRHPRSEPVTEPKMAEE